MINISKTEVLQLNTTSIYANSYREFYGILGLFRYFNALIIGLFRPIYRQVTKSDMRIVAHKSSALAAQNFMLSMRSNGYDTCPMEGFDSLRVKKTLSLPRSAEINMIISCGIRDEKEYMVIKLEYHLMKYTLKCKV